MTTALIEKVTIESSQKEVDPLILQFIEDYPDYRIHYADPFGKVMILPFDGDALSCQPKYDNNELYFESSDGQLVWFIRPNYFDYDIFYQQLLIDVEKSKNWKPKDREFTDKCLFNARHIVFPLTHRDRQYEAHWYQEGSVFYLYRKDCPNLFCAGVVTVKPMDNWTQETFLFVAKIAINAFLDGANTASF